MHCEPNTIVIAAATRRLLSNLFELRALGPKEVKGIAGPVRAFAVLRAKSLPHSWRGLRPNHTQLALLLLAPVHRQRFLSDYRTVRTCRPDRPLEIVKVRRGYEQDPDAALDRHFAAHPEDRGANV
jgi:hypothetical protein